MARDSERRPAPSFHWFVPIDGDGDHIGTRRAERPPTFEYLRSVVLAAEDIDYDSLLVPTRFVNGLFEESAPLSETWTTATALAAVTTRIRFLIAVRPGFVAAGLFAQMAATLDNISGGRIDLNVVPGGIQGDFERLGETSGHATRYRRADEFIEACRLLWDKPGPTTYHGEVVELDGAVVSPGPVAAGPRFYLGGASEEALDLAGRRADTLLMWIQPQEAIAELMGRAAARFEAAGRRPRFGLRSHVVVRGSEDDAWDAAAALLSEADDVVRQQRIAATAGTAMVGQRAQTATYDEHRMGRHLWNGISTVRVNCGTALVGSPSQIVDELMGYWRLGVDEFILSGFPHLEECRRVAEDVLPALRQSIEAER